VTILVTIFGQKHVSNKQSSAYGRETNKAVHMGEKNSNEEN
jgi:hypothetical protein